MARLAVSQPLRYTFLIIELLALLVANRFAYGTWLPSSHPSGLWFYAALFGLLLGHRLDTPFFTSPKDAVLYAVPSFVAALQIPDAAWSANGKWGQTAHTLLVVWIALVLAASSAAIWLQFARTERLARWGAAAMQLSGSLGNSRAFFSVILFFVLLAFPPQNVEGLLLVAVAWAVTVPFSLLDYSYALIRRIGWSLAKGTRGVQPAEVISFQYPGHLLVRTARHDFFPVATVIAYRDAAADVRLAYIVNHAGRDSGVLMRAVDLGASEIGQTFPELTLVDAMQAMPLALERLTEAQRASVSRFRENYIGFVAPETDIGRLLIEITASKELSAGRLVKTLSGSREVFYQLTNGLTKEEVVQQKSTYGFVAAQARCVGVWVESEARFKPLSWVPSPNAPVELVEEKVGGFEKEQIGTFPGTDFAVRLKNVHHLVTHNTAILGILGVGKSMLAMELVERVLAVGCKVMVMDLTDQYAS